MGEAVYYLRARFQSEEVADKTLPIVEAFFARCNEAEDYWQDHRMSKEVEEARHIDANIRSRYGDVFTSLDIPVPNQIDRSLNYLAGQLNAPRLDVDGRVYVDGDEIRCWGTVWHFADWGGLEHYFKSIGALAVAWVNDEYLDPFDSIHLD